MATSIPTFKLQISEGMIDVDQSADRLFGYCVEAPKGPVLDPIFVASNTEAKRIFGVDFAPHFFQKPTGLVICRVGFEKMAKAKIVYQAYPMKNTETDNSKPPVWEVDKTEANKRNILSVEASSDGASNHRVLITKSLTGAGYNLSVTIDGVTAKNYQNLRNLTSVVKKINSKFGNYLEAKLLVSDEESENKEEYFNKDTNGLMFSREQFVDPVDDGEQDTDGLLTGGSNGVMLNTDGSVSNVLVTDEVQGLHKSEGHGTLDTNTGKKAFLDDETNPETTLRVAYEKAFEKIQEVDLIGIATLSNSRAVQNTLIEHINEVNDPEVAQLRFGITGYLDYVIDPKNTNEQTSVEDLTSETEFINNEWIIYIGQAVVFEQEGNKEILMPYQATQLYTGLRSALGYSEAIFGGEPKKVLTGVVDTLPVINDGSIIVKSDIEQLNEAGVCTFKKEYGEVTFTEGVTTVQDEDVLSYESMMSIVAYVTKRLIKIAKPYQGQLLTEDLKSTLTTALSTELKTITDTDGTLMALEDFNIPPYDVQVFSAAKTKFNDANQLVRESKIIIQVRIVPVGALRDIDLGVIVI